MPRPPFDRAVALTCTLPALRTRWVYARCGCAICKGHSIQLVLLKRRKAARWTRTDLVVRVRYRACRGKVLTIHLTPDGIPAGGHSGDRPTPTCALLLHGEPPSATNPHA